MAAEVLVDAPAPVLVIGPEADVSSGLGMSEILVALDGSAESEQILPIAVDWAKTLKLQIVLAGVVREGAGGQETHTSETSYLRGHLAKVAREVPDASFVLIEAIDPATGLCSHLAERPQAIGAMSTHGRSGVNSKPLGRVSQAVMLRSPRPDPLLAPSRLTSSIASIDDAPDRTPRHCARGDARGPGPRRDSAAGHRAAAARWVGVRPDAHPDRARRRGGLGCGERRAR